MFAEMDEDGIVLEEDGYGESPPAEALDGVSEDACQKLPDEKMGSLGLHLDPRFEESEVPVKCSNGEPCCVGIDEAGRGPVLGPMMYGAAYWPISEKEAIDKLGFNDSKQLKDKDRERFLKIIKAESDRIGSVLCEISAECISTNMMLRNPVSLNKLSHDAAINMIKRIMDKGVNVAEIYVDAVGNCDIYADMLRRRFPNTTVTVEAKADGKYKVVGAASIVAKVARDHSLKDWVFREQYRQDGTPIPSSKCLQIPNCSGYPGDAKTVEWLHKNSNPIFGYPSIVRFSWKTTRNLLGELDDDLDSVEKKKKDTMREENNHPEFCKVEWAYEESEAATPKLAAFLNKTRKRPRYFQERKLQRVVKFI